MSKNIFIKTITLKNFGGIANATYSFEKGYNVIAGQRGAGKTSARNAFLWVLGFSAPNWEPMINGCRIYKIETAVTVELDVDGTTVTLARTNVPYYKKEKIVNEQGEESIVEAYNKSSFAYFYNGTQTSTVSEYKDKIAELFGLNAFDLELVCNVSRFNNDDLPTWDKTFRREYLFKLFDIQQKTKELENKPEYKCLKEFFERFADDAMPEIKIEQALNEQKRKIEEENEKLNVLITDCQDRISKHSAIDFDALEAKDKSLNEQLAKLYSAQKESVANVVRETKLKQLVELEGQITEIELNNSRKRVDYDNKIRDIEQNITNGTFKMRDLRQNISSYKIRIEKAQKELQEWEAETFQESDTLCPFCNQKLPADKIQDLQATFEKEKADRINISQNEISENERLKALDEAALENLENDSKALETALNDAKSADLQLISTEELKKQAVELKASLEKEKTTDADIELKNQIDLISQAIKENAAELAKKNLIEEEKQNIEKLKGKIRELAIQDQERIQQHSACMAYADEKTKLVNDEVNSHFDKTSFKFYEQLSGAARFSTKLTCLCTMNGTDYDNLSSGEKVEADFYVNNSLRKILGVNIPQFVDDIVLGDFETQKTDWQRIVLITEKNKKLSNTLIKDIYTEQDCWSKKD